MSQERPLAEPDLAPRRQMSIRFDQLKRTPAMNIIGLPELIGLAGAALIAILTIFAYFYFYVPAGFRLRSVELENKDCWDSARRRASRLNRASRPKRALIKSTPA